MKIKNSLVLVLGISIILVATMMFPIQDYKEIPPFLFIEGQELVSEIIKPIGTTPFLFLESQKFASKITKPIGFDLLKPLEGLNGN